MRANVFTDARLAKLAGRFVWLDIDTEKPRNFPFVAKFPIDAWPTILVVDPVAEKPVVRWAGAADAREVEALALQGEQALRAAAGSDADRAMIEGRTLAAERQHAAAAARYREALARGGPAWAGRPAAADALLQALGFAGDELGCAEAGLDLLGKLPRGPAWARIAASALGCANGVTDDAARARLTPPLEARAREALGVRDALTDDLLGAHESLLGARKKAKDDAGVRRAGREWLDYVERESARASSAWARSAFDGARLSAALAAGVPERALGPLLASEKALPEEFFPPTYLAVLYLELQRPKEALAAAGRALERAQGPRRVRVLVAKAKAEAALGEKAAALASAQQAVREGEELPEASRPRGFLGQAKKLVAEWSAPAPAAAPAQGTK